MTTVARQPLELVEIELDRCTLSYATGACGAPAANGTAAPLGSQCYNTFGTCVVPQDYNRGDTTLTFSSSVDTGITDRVVFPALQSVTSNPTEVALSRRTSGSGGPTLGSFGKRDRTRVRLQDFTFGDNAGIDPYLDSRVHDPNQGTFFGKLRARNPHYYGRALRVLTGFVGDARSDMVIRHYIMTEWNGPDSDGNVMITAQDPLVLADAELSRWPKPSLGALPVDLSPTDTTFFINDIPLVATYGISGALAIGGEIMRFQRVGRTFTLTERGADGTEATAHSQGDTVQECYRVVDELAADVLRELLRDGAGIPQSQLPVAEWRQELRDYLQTVRLTRTVAKPTSVRDLISEIAALGLIIWWDHTSQTVKVRVSRPLFGESAAVYSDESDILEGSVSRADNEGDRASQVWVYHGVVSYTGDVEDPDNYAKLYVSADLDSEGANAYDQSRILEIFQPWLGTAGNDVYVPVSANRLLSRYKDTPADLSFAVDASRGPINPGDILSIRSGVSQDATGAAAVVTAQVRSVDQDTARSRISIKAQEFAIAAGRFGRIAPNNYPDDYDNATDVQKAHGTWLIGTGSAFADGQPAYLLF